MNLKFFILLYITASFHSTHPSQNRINIHIPTSDEEADYVWRNIQDIKFFEEHNYQINLPQGELIQSLLVKSRNGELSSADFDALKTFMRTEVYQATDYQMGAQKIEAQRDLINKMVNKMIKCKRNWTFKSFETYQINLTLYGPGGSYNPDDGSVLIFTTKTGQFKQYQNPANTLIHEITHIGIEASIINKFKVPHVVKERIVDKMVSHYFKKYLPEYSIQDMGHNEIDTYLKTKKDFKNLHNAVKRFVAEN